MKTTSKINSKKIGLIKTKITALTAKEQRAVAGGGPNNVIKIPVEPASYGCTL